MQKRGKITVLFFILLAFSILIFILSTTGLLSGPASITAKILSPFQSLSFSGFNFLSDAGNSEVKNLKKENAELLKKLIDQDSLKKDNVALRDQFAVSSPKSTTLLPSKVVGAPGFIPGITEPDFLILDKGKNDKVKIGSAVVVGNVLVGKVVSISDYFSKVSLVTNTSFLLTAEDQRTRAQGVIKGDGGREMVLDNVVQSQELKSGDILITKGSQDESGTGIPPGLIIGKILSVEKKPSAVFQKGEVLSPIEFSKLSSVFIVVY